MRPPPTAVLALAAALALAAPALAAPKHAAPAHPKAAASPAPKADAGIPPGDAAGAAPAADTAAPAAEGAVTDMRCIVVAGALLQSEDAQMKSVGRASLFYYIGRLQGRGDVANLDARVLEQADKMTEKDIGAQSKICGGMFTGAAQALQDLSHAFEQHFGGPGSGSGGGAGGAAPK